MLLDCKQSADTGEKDKIVDNDTEVREHQIKCFKHTGIIDGFGGLLVSMLASGTQVCGFKPGRSRWIFAGIKILSMPSSGGEVKESVPCPSFAACQRT